MSNMVIVNHPLPIGRQRLSKAFYDKISPLMAETIRDAASRFHLASIGVAYQRTDHVFRAGEGEHWRVQYNGYLSPWVEMQAEHNIGAAGLAQDIGAGFSAPPGAEVLMVDYYDRFYAHLYIIDDAPDAVIPTGAYRIRHGGVVYLNRGETMETALAASGMAIAHPVLNGNLPEISTPDRAIPVTINPTRAAAPKLVPASRDDAIRLFRRLCDTAGQLDAMKISQFISDAYRQQEAE